MASKLSEYALYKGDQLVSVGTVREIAKERGVLEKTIRFYQSGTYKRRFKENSNQLILIRLDEDE